jgi:hypothetical protein
MNNTITKMIKYIKNYIEDDDLTNEQVKAKYGEDYQTLVNLIINDGTWNKFETLYLKR